MKTISIRKFLPYLIVALGIVYGIWPIDLIPDAPIVGWIDDIGVIGTTILLALILHSKNRNTITKEKS